MFQPMAEGPRVTSPERSREDRSDLSGPVVSNPGATRAADLDEVLLARLATGEHGAEVAFVRRFQCRVYGLARFVVGDQALAEDIARDAFTRAWRQAPHFDPGRGSVTTWVLTITRNAAIDALRRRPEPVEPNLLRLMAHAAQEMRPEWSAPDGDAVVSLRAAIGQLPVEQRRALFLASFYGRTAHEIGISEGIPISAAQTRIRAAMTKLRAAHAAPHTAQ
jgi:RNA polymerase sigma-70 factor (ECF subfamily)